MGTEIESPNSNHRVSKLITDSFLFLEGEDDEDGGGGVATNGNSRNGVRSDVNDVNGGVISHTGNGAELNSPTKGQSVSTSLMVTAANGNSSPGPSPNGNTVCLAGEKDRVSKDTIGDSSGTRVKFPDESIRDGVKFSAAMDKGARCISPISFSNQIIKAGVNLPGDIEEAAHTASPSGTNLSYDGELLGWDESRSSTIAAIPCDKYEVGAGCSDGLVVMQKGEGRKCAARVHISNQQVTYEQTDARCYAASAASRTEAEEYEALLQERARMIVGKVLNCNSLREALKKSQGRRSKAQPLWVWQEPAASYSADLSASGGVDNEDGITGSTVRFASDPNLPSKISSARPKEPQLAGNSKSKNTVGFCSVVETVSPQQTSASEPSQWEVSTDVSCDRASAAVKLRRKKSEVGSKPTSAEAVSWDRQGSYDRGSCDSASSSPGQSPGPGTRHILRSPVLRLKQEWNSVEIASDSDSPRQSEDSDDDDDGGIYAESYRHSQWLYIGGALGSSSDTLDTDDSRSSASTSIFDTSLGDADVTCEDGEVHVTSQKERLTSSIDSGLGQSESSPRLYKQRAHDDDLPPTLPRRPRHHRSESISTTASEIEFRKRYQAKTKRIVHRKSSTQTYQRMSERFYDDERSVVIEKREGDLTFGFHIKGHHPVMVSTVEMSSAAEVAGVKVGDAMVAVNDVNVLEVSHQEAIKLIGQDTSRVKLTLATDHRVLSDVPLCTGFLIKQGGSGILKNWRRRWFLLKQDHCLYYYKTEEDKDPLGAIMLTNYTVTKAPESNRKHTFKAHKYGQRTYYFQAESEDDMNRWASALSNAAKASTKTDTWLDVSSHNVGLPALSIKAPDCHGHLTKMGNRRKNWKRRYCVLKDACLYYYIDLTSSTAQGVAHLHGYSVQENLPFHRKFGFMLIPPDPSMRTFYFCADNETDMKRWIKALQKSIGRWIREEDY